MLRKLIATLMVLIIGLNLVLVSGCQTKAQTGALIGGAAGAGIGAAVGDTKGALIGGALGAGGGYLVTISKLIIANVGDTRTINRQV